MAKKYKLSEGNVFKFFGLFGSKDKPKTIQQVIDNDPKLKALDRQMADLNRKAADSIRNDKDRLAIFKKAGVEITGGY
jgi:hypothetical protein